MGGRGGGCAGGFARERGEGGEGREGKGDRGRGRSQRHMYYWLWLLKSATTRHLHTSAGIDHVMLPHAQNAHEVSVDNL